MVEKTCANYALQRTATHKEEEMPFASRSVKRNCYMYDFLYSAENIQEAKSLKPRFFSLLQQDSFYFSKWQSYVHELFEKESDAESVNALGLEWNFFADDLKLCRDFAVKEHSVITHKVVLSVPSSVFDPLGLATPFTMGIGLILRLI